MKRTQPSNRSSCLLLLSFSCSNFSNYKALFSMPGDRDNMYYSFNMGPIHFVSISTEFYFYLEYGVTQLGVQYEWLINDLKVTFLSINLRHEHLCNQDDTQIREDRFQPLSYRPIKSRSPSKIFDLCLTWSLTLILVDPCGSEMVIVQTVADVFRVVKRFDFSAL